MVTDMSTLDNLNAKYVDISNKIETLQSYYAKVSAENNAKGQSVEKITKALQHMRKMVSEISCGDYSQITDTIAIVETYMLCIEAINEYKKDLLSHKKVDRTVVMKAVDNISKQQATYDQLKEEYYQKYRFLMNTDIALSSAMSACIGNVVSAIREDVEQIKKEAKAIVSKEFSVE